MAHSNNNMPQSVKVERQGIWVQICLFHNRHFPTDRKTYEVRFPLIGAILSLLTLYVISNILWNDYSRSSFYLTIVFFLTISSVSYGLYYGLHIGDRKQYTPWLILKTVEMLTIFGALINCLVDPRCRSNVSYIILGFFVLAFNVAQFYKIVRKYLEANTNAIETDYNVYEFPPG